MTDPLDDGELRAMLGERASRMAPDSAREALAAVRSVVRGSAAGRGGFSVLAIGPRGSDSRLPVALVVAGMVTVLVVGLIGGRLGGGPTARSAGPVGPSAAVPSPPAASPGAKPAASPAAKPATSPAAKPATNDAARLRPLVANGTLDGHLLVVDGELEAIEVPCREPGACTVLALTGLEGIIVTDERQSPGPDPGTLPGRGQLVFTPHDGALAFLGVAPARLDRPTTVAELGDSLGGALGARRDLLEVVSGWLVVGGLHSCPLLGPGATSCPGPPPWLTDDKPFDEGMLSSNVGMHVGIADPLAGGPITQTVTEGPFLVRPVSGWEVVAVLGSAPVARATLP
jgi:hypothetical protein